MGSLVFVVGAGASSEFDLPTGERLKSHIADTLWVNREPFQLFRDNIFNKLARKLRSEQMTEESIVQAANLIRKSMGGAPSIDNFVHTHRNRPEVEMVAKIAIAKCILEAERKSKLYVPDDNIHNELDLTNLTKTWLLELFKVLAQQGDFLSFLDRLSKIYFISFNYDRCIHQFFWFASRTYFKLTDEEAMRVVERLNVEYPYGTVGELRYDAACRTGFGSVDEQQVYQSALNLRTFTEGCASDFPEKVQAIFSSARRVYFLGFGFLPLNMEILLGASPYEVEGVYGTAKGLPAMQLAEVKQDLAPHFVRQVFATGHVTELVDKIKLSHCTASELIWEHSRSLARI